MSRVYCRSWDEMPAVLTLDLVAAICGKTPECIRKWAVANKIPATKTPDGWLIDKASLRTWFRENGNDAMKQIAS